MRWFQKLCFWDHPKISFLAKKYTWTNLALLISNQSMEQVPRRAKSLRCSRIFFPLLPFLFLWLPSTIHKGAHKPNLSGTSKDKSGKAHANEWQSSGLPMYHPAELSGVVHRTSPVGLSGRLVESGEGLRRWIRWFRTLPEPQAPNRATTHTQSQLNSGGARSPPQARRERANLPISS